MSKSEILSNKSVIRSIYMDFRGSGVCTCGTPMSGGGGSFGGSVSTSWRTCECGIKALFYSVSEGFELKVSVESLGASELQEKEKEKLLGAFALAGFEVLRYWEIKNQYSGNVADWLLVKTPLGLVTLGWRKRVISLEWEDTGIEYMVSDDVTKDVFHAHAWGYADLVKYLVGLKEAEKFGARE